MINDSLKIKQNNDGSFTAEWDKQDPNWKWMNNLTTEEIQCIIKEAISCLLYTSPSPRDRNVSRMPSSA